MPSSDTSPETPTPQHAAAALRPQRDGTVLADARSGSALDPSIAAALKRDDAGLVAAVVQQYDSREVLMLGWMDEEALRRTLTSGRVTFWSRSREEYWRKGDTSGHRQWVRSVALDCDGDAVLVTVDQEGAACHTGTRTCFDGRELPLTAPEGSPGSPGSSAVPAGSTAEANPQAEGH